MTRELRKTDSGPPVGVWLVGARGAISTCVAYGLAGLARGVIEPFGVTTACPPCDRLGLASYESMVLGGHDVCARTLSQSAGELEGAGVLSGDLLATCASEAAAYGARIRPGLLDEAEVGGSDLDPGTTELSALSPRDAVARLIQDWEEFEQDTGAAKTVVVYLASTEAARSPQPEWEDLRSFEGALDEGRPQPASVLYAYAALSSGRPFVNFTPSLGSSLPALRQLAVERRVPHCGNDGKTGETLVKTVLAPMFAARALHVMSWQGYNMLGNRDGEVLRDEAHKQAKVLHKDEALRQILGNDPRMHSQVGIDYVPSLGDWKTAWDFIHFEGFLGAKMSLQFTWAGSDSALAAPLVIDLVRWAEFAARRGEYGELEHTACYFKSPLGGGTHDFHRQHAVLEAYAARHLEGRRQAQ